MIFSIVLTSYYRVVGVNNFASEEIMPISDVKHRGVDFDHLSGAGECPAEAPARSATCGASPVMPELFWWGRLEEQAVLGRFHLLFVKQSC